MLLNSRVSIVVVLFVIFCGIFYGFLYVEFDVVELVVYLFDFVGVNVLYDFVCLFVD